MKHHIPLIKFLGPRHLLYKNTPPIHSSLSPPVSTFINNQNNFESLAQLPKKYHMLPFSLSEIEAIQVYFYFYVRVSYILNLSWVEQI